MAGQWKEVAKLRFKGDRFRDHALDLSAVTELRQFQKMVAETAKALWRAANPDRKNLPAHFENRTRLCLRSIEDGSATTPLEVYIEERDQGELWEPEPKEIEEAIELAYGVFDSLEHDRPLPERFPRELVTEYAKWGESLAEDEEVEFTPTGNGKPRCPARLDAKVRNRFDKYAETPHSTTTEIIGTVQEADVRQRRFQVWIDDKTSVIVPFTPDQEETATSALKEHRSVRIRVRGRADVSPEGKLLKFVEVTELNLLKGAAQEFDPNAPSIEDELARIAATVPESDWATLPANLSDRLDDYIYGTEDE